MYSVIIPLYNEEEVISQTYQRLKSTMDNLNENYELVFVNDGSEDDSENIVTKICKIDSNARLINFTRNFGHQPAIMAGLKYSSGDAIIIIDADLQDPPEFIPKMIEKWKEGYDIVHAVRDKREGEGYFVKITAKLYYRVLNRISSIKIRVDSGDFKLMGKEVRDILISLPEKNKYLRGLVDWCGFNQTEVEYIREKRNSGKTKYSLKKRMKLALTGITSFSKFPLKITMYLGGAFLLISFIDLVYFLLMKSPDTVDVNMLINVLFILIIFLFGIVFLALGIIGEYIAAMNDELKARPIYLIHDVLGFNHETDVNGEFICSDIHHNI